MKKKILVVDDSNLERIILSGLLAQEYDVLTADGGKNAMEILEKEYQAIAAVILDVVMPHMDGFTVLKKIRENPTLHEMPVFISSALDDEGSREKLINYGANGFVNKPYDNIQLMNMISGVIKFNGEEGCSYSILRDSLTGLLSRESFISEAERKIKTQKSGYYTLSCFDVENFKVINEQYGTDKGDEVLVHISDCLNKFVESINGLTCRFMADKFAILYPTQYKDTREIKNNHDEIMYPECINRGVRIRIGRYLVNNPSIPVSTMIDRAMLAESSIKGRYGTYITEYDNSMTDCLIREQKIINEMEEALAEGQFEPWYQPQYNHSTGAMIGAEALVRWRKNGQLIPPNDFLPIFERNGFIYKMDQSIWKQVCIALRRWLNQGKEPLPVSVNVSRHDLLQQDFMTVICGLVDEYKIPRDLFRIEITESAFSQFTDEIVSIVNLLIEHGFTVEIDDFGSGYSSLNTLKDVPASILKLDMKFLDDSSESKRGNSILEAMVRMTKWLGMSVIAEGVEEKIQADYLKSIGCNYIQGYYYAKPLPIEKYESLLFKNNKEYNLTHAETIETLNSSEFWDPKSMETLIFNSYVGGAAILEYYKGRIEPIRVNEKFKQEFGNALIEGIPVFELLPEDCMDRENLNIMYNNINRAIKTKKESTCDVRISGLDNELNDTLYLRCTIRMIAWTDDRQLLYCVFHNITSQHMAEQREHEHNAELMDNLPCGAGIFEYDGKTLQAKFLNKYYWEMVGKKPSRRQDDNVMEMVHPEDRGNILPEIADAISQKRDAVCQTRVMTGNGSYKKFHVVCRAKKKTPTMYSLYAFFIPSSADSLLLEEQNKRIREKNRMDFIFKNAALSVWSYNARTKEIIQNEQSQKIHGYNSVVTNVPESLIESGFIHPDSVDEYLAMYEKLNQGAKEAEGVFRVKTYNRSGYWFEHIRYAAISDGDFSERLFFGISMDVSAEYEQEDAIKQWMSLVSEMQVENNTICEFNLTQDSFVRKQGNLFPLFKFSKTDSFNENMFSWIRENVYSEDAEKVADYFNRDNLIAMHGKGVLDGGLDYRAVINNEVIWCNVNIKFVEYPGDNDIRLIMIHTDINSRKKNELQLIEETRRDHLTGALNRKAFEYQVNQVLNSGSDTTNALLMIDLDDFKNINDTFGHMTGDKVLRKTVEGLKPLLRGSDIIGRIGGDEFMVFLKNIQNRDVISKRALKIVEMIAAISTDTMEVSGSLGIAISPKDGDTFDSLYKCADKAAYYSKKHGKNRFSFYKPNFGTNEEYGDTISSIDIESDEVVATWGERTSRIMAENQRLIERQEEDERYRMVIESTHIITFEWNAIARKFSASPEFSQYVLSQQSGEQFFSENVDITGIHPDDRTLFYGKFLEKVLSGESAPDTSLRLELKSGGYRWCRLGAIIQFDKMERLQKAIGIITAENVQKKKSDMQLDAIFKYMSAGVILFEIKNPDIEALYISESYFRLENTEEVTMLEGDALRYVHHDDYQRLKEKLFICSMSGAVMEDSFRVVHGEKILWRHMHAVRIPYPDVVNPVMIAVETDITNLKQREEQLEKQLYESEKKSEKYI